MEIRAAQPDWSTSPEDRLASLGQRLHLWLIDSDAVVSIADSNLLNRDEVRRWNRYLRSEDRDLFLVAHVFTRRVLSLYADVAPGEWAFSTNEYGRPEIAGPEHPGLRFNLAHTNGMVAVLVHDETDAGVDIEQIGRVEDPLAMAANVFADQERALLQGLGPAELDARFSRLWTLKESFIKAKGMGLAIPLKDFWFSVDVPPPIRMDCLAGVDPEPGTWQFAIVEPAPNYVVAVARSAPGRILDVFTPALSSLW